MTTVISFFAGPGAGKSTTAAKLFVELKERGLKAELVQEYVKSWAWEGKKITPLDQFYIMSKQIRSEARLYGKVDYIITDSPIELSAFYDNKYNNSDVLYTTIGEFAKRAVENHGVKRVNVLINRDKPYHRHGRYETEDQAKAIDTEMRDLLNRIGLPFHEVKTGDVDSIIKELQIHGIFS